MCADVGLVNRYHVTRQRTNPDHPGLDTATFQENTETRTKQHEKSVDDFREAADERTQYSADKPIPGQIHRGRKSRISSLNAQPKEIHCTV